MGSFEELQANLINRRVSSWQYNKLTLDDGTELSIELDYGDGPDYGVDGEFSDVVLDAMITDVSYPELISTNTDFYGTKTSIARITIFHNRNPIALAKLNASDSGSIGWCDYYTVASLSLKGVTYKIVDPDGLIEEDELNGN